MKWFIKLLKILVGILIFPITVIISFIYFMKRLLEWLFGTEEKE